MSAAAALTDGRCVRTIKARPTGATTRCCGCPAPGTYALCTAPPRRQCGCCEAYAAYLEQNGFKVHTNPIDNLSQISSDAGVPADLEGCHTLMVDGYVVDGLVPVDIVRKLLTGRPAISGVTPAGMPTGTPGMGGEKAGTWTIYAFTKDGKAPTVYATR